MPTEALTLSSAPVCCCPRTIKIDGEEYDVLNPTGAGCRLHHMHMPDIERVSKLESSRRVAGRVHGRGQGKEFVK